MSDRFIEIPVEAIEYEGPSNYQRARSILSRCVLKYEPRFMVYPFHVRWSCEMDERVAFKIGNARCRVGDRNCKPCHVKAFLALQLIVQDGE